MNHSAKRLVAATCLFGWLVVCRGEPPRFLSVSEPTLKDRGQHHRTWERVSSYVTSYGRVVTRTNAYQEIGTGMSWLDREANSPVWRDTEETFELFAGGAIARKGPHQLIVSPRLTDTPVWDILTPDGQRLQGNLWGVVYRDPVSGNNVLIAEPNPEAELVLVAPNRWCSKTRCWTTKPICKSLTREQALKPN